MEQLEEQLLAKILALQKERHAANTDRSQQQHDIEKELSALQNRVAELEHGECCPRGTKVRRADADPKGKPRGARDGHPHSSPSSSLLPSLVCRCSRLQSS